MSVKCIGFLDMSQFEALYGQENYTFNMHLHLHYGPAHASWCYALTGYLGPTQLIIKDIELQIIRRFSEHQAIYSEDTIYAEYESILPYKQ